jgi:hypothetical protein
MKSTALKLIAALVIAASSSFGQNLLPTQTGQGTENDHLLWIIPNYRTSPSLENYQALTTSQKLKIAGQDSWDRGTVALSVILAGQAQLSNSNRSFGQGTAGYARYLGSSYGDFVIGNYMTEGVFPTILHQDPRYFRRGTGGAWSRLGYALSQTFITHGDSGTIEPNYSEWLGNATGVAVSNAYYADNRTARDGVSKLGVQIGIDAAANALKEFYPDIGRLFRRKHDRD